MNFNRKELLAAVKACSKLTPKKVLQPVLACVKLTSGNVVSTDLDTSLSINLLGTGDGTIVTPAKKLAEILGSLTTMDVVFDLTDNTLNGFKLETFDPDDYPLIPSIEGDPSTIHAEDMLDTLSKTMSFAANYDYTSILGGIHFKKLVSDDSDCISGDANVCSTDGSRLSWVKTTIRGAELDAIVPHLALKLMEGQFKAAAKRKSVIEIRTKHDKIQFTTSEFQIIMRQISGQFPRYLELFPEANGRSLHFNRTKALEALKPLKPFLDERTNVVDVELDGFVVGGNKSSISLGIKGEVEPFRVNYHYMTQALESLTDEVVKIELHGALKPLVFVENDYKHLLMPVQKK